MEAKAQDVAARRTQIDPEKVLKKPAVEKNNPLKRTDDQPVESSFFE